MWTWRRFATLAAMAPTRPVDAGDDIRAPGRARGARRGAGRPFAVVVRRTVERNGYVSHLWLVAAGRPRDRHAATAHDGSRPRQPAADLARRPDASRSPARLPEDAERHSSLRAARPRRGGRPRRCADGPRPVGEVAWSPDGRRLAFTAEVGPPRFLVEGRRATAGPRRTPAGAGVIAPDRLALGRGRVIVDRWSHLFVVAAAGSHGRAAGHRRRLGRGRHRLAARRADDRVRRRTASPTRTSGRGRRSGRSTSDARR